MKKLLVIALLMLALVITAVACQPTPDEPDTSADDVTTAETPTEAPTDEPSTPAPETEPETPAPETPAPETDPETPAPETEPETPAPETEPPVDPMEPVNVFDADDISGMTGMKQIASAEMMDGYLHIVPGGTDPYWYPFSAVDGARYVAVRYRTADATGANMQIFIGSTGNGPTNDDSMTQIPLTVDGEWNLAIFDTQAIIDKGLYDGTFVSYFRFDVMEAGYILDENGEPFKDENNNWVKYHLPEGCSIDIAYIGFFLSAEAAAKYDFENYPPYVEADDPAAGKKNHSFDTFYVNGQMYFPEDGGAGDKLTAQDNTITFAPGEAHDSMILRGWIGFEQPIVEFGYFLDNYEFVFNPDYTKPTEDGVKAAGGEHALRFEIFVPLADLMSNDHFAGFVVKLEDGTIVRLRENITVDLADDITDTFISDVASNEDGTDLQASDLANFFTVTYGAGEPHAVTGGTYHYGGINEMFTTVDGLYAYTVNMTEAGTTTMMFVRGTHVVHSVDLPAPANGLYPINNYYETDGNGHMGGAGIYAAICGGKLNIFVKAYDDASTAHIALKKYMVDVDGSAVTIADAGDTVYFIVDGKLVATIALSGETTYEKICDVAEGVTFAQTAVVTLADGTTETIENTMVVASYQSQIGIAIRGGAIKFDSVKVEGLSAVEIPAEFYVPVAKENVALNKPVSADSVENATNIPSNATDGDDTTRWGATPNGEANLIVDLGEVYDLIGLDVYFENAGWEYTISLSQDGVEYTVIAENERHASKMVSIKGEASARYIKFTRLQDDDSAAHWFSIYEVYAYTKAAEEPDTPDEPTVENVVIDLSTVEGFKSTNNYGYDCPIIDVGYNEVYLLGDIDLSKYSQIIIKYSHDGDTVTDRTPEQCWAECGRPPIIGITTINKCFGYANVTNQDAIDAGFYADLPYTSGNWSANTRTAVIDLTGVTYSGPCYLSVYNPWNRGIAVVSIELVPVVETEPEAPAVENYNVPQSQWVITGHNNQLNDATNPMVAAGGVESAALLHQGSISLGEIDLSKYSKAVVMWGCDNSQTTIDRYNANPNNRIMLLNDEMSLAMSPAEGTVIAGGTYELKGWAVTAFEIDLTGIDYNGPVWLAIDSLPGTFALVASVEFVA